MMALAACGSGGAEEAPITDVADAPTSPDAATADDSPDSPNPTMDGEAGSTPRESGGDDDADSDQDSGQDSDQGGDGTAETVDADAIQFAFAGTEMLCWGEDAEDGGDGWTVFGCQAAADWESTQGGSPASVLMFKLDDDGAPGEIVALQANAPVTAWEIQRVQPGGTYDLGGAIIDLTDERLSFTAPVEGKDETVSGWVTIDDYGWGE